MAINYVSETRDYIGISRDGSILVRHTGRLESRLLFYAASDDSETLMDSVVIPGVSENTSSQFIAMSYDASHVVLCSSSSNNFYINYLKRDGSSWIHKQTIISGSDSIYGYWGTGEMSDDGLKMAIAEPDVAHDGFSYKGEVEFYTRDGNFWTKTATYIPSTEDDVAIGSYGSSPQKTLDMSADGSLAAVVAAGYPDPYDESAPYGLYYGKVWELTHNGGVSASGTGTVPGQGMGGSISMSADGSVVVGGAWTDNASDGYHRNCAIPDLDALDAAGYSIREYSPQLRRDGLILFVFSLRTLHAFSAADGSLLESHNTPNYPVGEVLSGYLTVFSADAARFISRGHYFVMSAVEAPSIVFSPCEDDFWGSLVNATSFCLSGTVPSLDPSWELNSEVTSDVYNISLAGNGDLAVGINSSGFTVFDASSGISVLFTSSSMTDLTNIGISDDGATIALLRNTGNIIGEIYTRSGNSWGLSSTFLNVVDTYFGGDERLAISGDGTTIVVSEPWYEPTANNWTGRLHVFTNGSFSNYVTPADINKGTFGATGGDHDTLSLTTSGDKVAVGSFGYPDQYGDDVSTHEGRLSIYNTSGSLIANHTGANSEWLGGSADISNDGSVYIAGSLESENIYIAGAVAPNDLATYYQSKAAGFKVSGNGLYIFGFDSYSNGGGKVGAIRVYDLLGNPIKSFLGVFGGVKYSADFSVSNDGAKILVSGDNKLKLIY